ncbi:MAG: ATP-binding protein [Methanoregulaceae archaeon]|jgi:MinD superfamily P-loop ATPase|nr:ATP-binding protein [Methanoregulaceae archaeon]
MPSKHFSRVNSGNSDLPFSYVPETSDNIDDTLIMKVTVASGKGGTGKSMVAANLAWALSETSPVTLVDCDVEEPNLHLFFPQDPIEREEVTVPVPSIDLDRCTFCGDCAGFCAYGALLVTKDRVLFFPDLCHSCGGCSLICLAGAIKETQRSIGTLTLRHISDRLHIVTGTLQEGDVLATKVIREAKRIAERPGWIVYDASPGTSCPVVETLQGSDLCLLVTESTPFGLHDLELAYSVTSYMGIPSGVVINLSDGRDKETRAFCEEKEIPVFATIPFDRWIAHVQGVGDLISRRDSFWKDRFIALGMACCSRVEEL